MSTSIFMRPSQLFLNRFRVYGKRTECLGSTTRGFLLLRKPQAASFLAQQALHLHLLLLSSKVWAEQQPLILARQLVPDQLLLGLLPARSLLQVHLLSRRAWSTGVPLGCDAGNTGSRHSSLFPAATLLSGSTPAHLPSGHSIQGLVWELAQLVHKDLHLHICGRKEVGEEMDLVLKSVKVRTLTLYILRFLKRYCQLKIELYQLIDLQIPPETYFSQKSHCIPCPIYN